MMTLFLLVGLLQDITTPKGYKAPTVQEPVAGSLVIVGGGKLPDSVRDEFFKLAGGEGKAKILVIPTASGDADKPDQATSFTDRWAKLKPASIALFHTRDKKQANDAEFVKPISEATAVWISGGDQNRVIDSYRGTLVEKELHALLKRGGVIGGTSAGAAVMTQPMITGGAKEATLGDGFGFLPGVIVDQHFVARNRIDRLRGVLVKHPDFPGLGIDEATAAVVKGRSIRVIGDSTVTVLWAKCENREARVDVLKPGEELDLFQIRRAALERAAKAPFPAVKPTKPEVPKGALVIIGGGGLPKPIIDKFFDLAGGKDASIVFIPTASEFEPNKGDAADLSLLKKLGATNVTVLHTRDRKQADNPEFSQVLLEAKAVWFSGGRHWRFIDSYEGTLTEKRFRTVLERGGVIGGTSAGASIQAEYMPRGHPLGNTVVSAEGYERGFGYLPGCAVDQHFFARKRIDDMNGLMKRYPQLLGIGIDEATAIVVQGTTAEVIGSSKVGFFDGLKPMVEVPSGAKYDLNLRKLIAQ
jgi:cyanophycinase